LWSATIEALHAAGESALFARCHLGNAASLAWHEKHVLQRSLTTSLPRTAGVTLRSLPNTAAMWDSQFDALCETALKANPTNWDVGGRSLA
jgi:hypothetical protein